MSDSWWPHGLQHARLPCPSPTLGAYSNLCPKRHWCHPTISSSFVPFSSRLQSFPASGSFPVSQFMLGWMMHKLESRLRGEISITSHMQLTASLWQMMESKEESKSLLRKFMKEGCEKAGLKLNIQKTKILASGPITSWQIDGETVETVTDFLFLGSKITADGDCSHEIRRCLLLGRKAMTTLDSILKSRDVTLPTKVHLVKVIVFPVVMYGCELDYKESWAPKNWCFWTVVLEKTLESPLDSKEIKPGNL